MSGVQTRTPEGVRVARTDNGTRVFVGADLIGTLDRRRFTPPQGGKKSWRWFVKPATYAWTRGRLDVPAPAAWLVQERPEAFTSRYGALVALVDHLHDHGAVAVRPLYRGSSV